MKNQKGFTLIELLAVVTLLGVLLIITIPAVTRWISKSKTESLESQKQTVQMAAESYAQSNTSVLPKVIGDTKDITLIQLKNAKYLKQDIRNADKKSCMTDSFVRIYKYSKTGYTYTVYLYCEGDIIPTGDPTPEPVITIQFTDAHGNTNDYNANVAITSIKIHIEGGQDDTGADLEIDGYSYTISAESGGQKIEIYNSGSLNAKGRKTLDIQRSLQEYVDISENNIFYVKAEVYNRAGGHKIREVNSNYHDTVHPICVEGSVVGEAAAGSWLKTPGSTRTISVECADGDGSGCVKAKYTKTFTTEMEWGVIVISDNAGNKTECPVRVNIDWSVPTLTITAYKRTDSAGKEGDSVGAITASPSSKNVTLNSYPGATNTNWFNRASFPNGVYYEIVATDNVHASTGQWSYNDSGIFDSSASNLNTLTKGSSFSFTAANTTTSVSLSAEGLRRAKYVVRDVAGNTATINIVANIDRTNPSCALKIDDGVKFNSKNDNAGSPSFGMNTTGTVEYNSTTSLSYANSTFYGYVKDFADNTNQCTVTVKGTNPNCTCSHAYDTCSSGSASGNGCYRFKSVEVYCANESELIYFCGPDKYWISAVCCGYCTGGYSLTSGNPRQCRSRISNLNACSQGSNSGGQCVLTNQSSCPSGWNQDSVTYYCDSDYTQINNSWCYKF